MTQTNPSRDIFFVDTTLRDGQLSLWASNMRTRMMLPVAERLDRAGFEAIEVMSFRFLQKVRARSQRRSVGTDSLTSTTHQKNAAANDPQPLYARFPDLSTGDYRSLARTLRQRHHRTTNLGSLQYAGLFASSRGGAKRAGIKTILNIIYSISPKHTDEYFIERAREAAKLDVARICFKDPGGLLTPEATRRLVPLMLREAKDKPVEFHTHCNTGLGRICCLEAIKLGVTSINTAIPPLADGSSNPSLFNVAMNARALGYTTSHR